MQVEANEEMGFGMFQMKLEFKREQARRNIERIGMQQSSPYELELARIRADTAGR